jgi:hypothetical protein
MSLALAACGAPRWKEPVPVEKVDFMTFAQSKTDGEVTVTVAVPDREQTTAIFGTSLYNASIQPVWIEVDNHGDSPYILVLAGIDSNSFSPLEAAFQRHSGSKDTKLAMDRFFYSMAFKNPIRAGQSVSGFVFTNVDEGHKAVNIDLLGDQDLKTFSFVVKVPGIITDIDQVDFEALHDSFTEIDNLQELRQVLESFPCCTTDKNGDKHGDPLNIVMIGSAEDVFSALFHSDWHQTEITYMASAMKTMKSFLFGSQYLYSPISPLYVFGRPQDVGLQKARSSINLRNHMRLWRTPYNFRGKSVILGQISRDIGVKFSKRTITTHAIDPDVDETRDNLIGNLAYSQGLIMFGYVKGSQVSTPEDTHYNLTPDPYFSDGYRAVMFFGKRSKTLDEIDFLDWEHTEVKKALRE